MLHVIGVSPPSRRKSMLVGGPPQDDDLPCCSVSHMPQLYLELLLCLFGCFYHLGVLFVGFSLQEPYCLGSIM